MAGSESPRRAPGVTCTSPRGAATARSLRVALIEPVGAHGGMDLYDVFLAESVRRAGADVTLYTSRVLEPDAARFQGDVRTPFRSIFGDAPRWMRGAMFVSATARTVAHALRSGKRVAHLHFFHAGVPELVSVLSARAAGLRVVSTVHDVEAFAPGLTISWIQRRVYELSDVLVVHSSIARRELVMSHAVDPAKIVLAPHGNVARPFAGRWERDKARDRAGIPRGIPVILFFGHIKEVKGLDILLRALPLVRSAHPTARLLIAGKPWRVDLERYERLIDSLDVRGACDVRARHIDNDEADCLYAAADVVALPYRRTYQSGVLLNAMARGTPAVASDLDGMREVLRDGVTGWLFRSEDPSDLASVLTRVLAAPESRREVAARALQYLAQEQTATAVGTATVRAYTQALNSARVGAPS